MLTRTSSISFLLASQERARSKDQVLRKKSGSIPLIRKSSRIYLENIMWI